MQRILYGGKRLIFPGYVSPLLSDFSRLGLTSLIVPALVYDGSPYGKLLPEQILLSDFKSEIMDCNEVSLGDMRLSNLDIDDQEMALCWKRIHNEDFNEKMYAFKAHKVNKRVYSSIREAGMSFIARRYSKGWNHTNVYLPLLAPSLTLEEGIEPFLNQTQQGVCIPIHL